MRGSTAQRLHTRILEPDHLGSNPSYFTFLFLSPLIYKMGINDGICLRGAMKVEPADIRKVPEPGLGAPKAPCKSLVPHLGSCGLHCSVSVASPPKVASVPSHPAIPLLQIYENNPTIYVRGRRLVTIYTRQWGSVDCITCDASSNKTSGKNVHTEIARRITRLTHLTTFG